MEGGSLEPWVLFGIVLSLVMASNLAAAMPKFSEWSTPINLGPTINSAANDVGPAISRDGLSLTSARTAQAGSALPTTGWCKGAARTNRGGLAWNSGPTTTPAANENF